MNPIFANETGSKKVKRVIERPLDFEMPPLPPMDIAWDPDSGSVLKAIDMMGGLGRTFKASCEAQLRDNATIQRLIDEQFDVAMAEFFDPCSLGLFRRLGIKKTIVLYASAMPLDDSTHFGLPAQPSSVPDFIIQSPVKSFFGRFVNTMSFLKALAKTSKLDEKYKKFLDSATEGAVFMSFGSVAQSHLMPNETKKAFLEAFAEFPNVHFMWKYEKPEHEIAKGHPNVMAEEWCNSLSEASWSGIPMIAIPLFGDQQRNAFNIEERGIGVQLSKGALTKDAIVAALRRVIYDDRYKQKAQKIARMIRAKPMSPDERFVKYTEFAAQHDVHEQLDLPGRHLELR
ncbi:UDP-glucuronosyltransferase [Aphelenchoides fujianensis]|nr:UDP-glucuronosyltransferase [Aphelenchoides fujianensis]